MKPDKIEFLIGETIHGQPLRLLRQKSTGGQMEWVLCRDEADQRDDRVFIAGLKGDSIQKMAEAVRSVS